MTLISNLFHSTNYFLDSAFQFPVCRKFCVPFSETGKRYPNLSVQPKFLRAYAKLRKATVSFVMSVCPSEWKNSALTGRIFVKFESLVFFENLSRKLVSLKSDKNGYYTLRFTFIYDISLNSS